jgi:hypothetical protein
MMDIPGHPKGADLPSVPPDEALITEISPNKKTPNHSMVIKLSGQITVSTSRQSHPGMNGLLNKRLNR